MTRNRLHAGFPDYQETFVQGATGNDTGFFFCQLNGFTRKYLAANEGMFLFPKDLRVMTVSTKQKLVGMGLKKQCRFAVTQNTHHAGQSPFLYERQGMRHDKASKFDDHGEVFEICDGCPCYVCRPTAIVVDDHLMIIVPFYSQNVVFPQQAYAMVGRFRMCRITDVTQVIDGFTAVSAEKGQGLFERSIPSVAIGHNADIPDGLLVCGSYLHVVRRLPYGLPFALQAS